METGGRAARVVAPGKIMIRELEARGWTQRDLAEIIGRPYQAVNEIINGTKQITPDTARELARAFGTSIDFWINLETNFRLHLAEKDNKEKEISRRSKLYSIAPVREMVKRSWIKKTSNLDELEKEICDFLNIASPGDPIQIPFKLRSSETHEPEINTQYAWIKRVEHLAEAQKVKDFEYERFCNSIGEIISFSKDERLLNKLPHELANLGIHFLIVKHLPRTYIDGAALVGGINPIIALTLRYDRIDSFWFTLAHELAHLCLKHDGIALDNTEEDKGSRTGKEEKEADQLAHDWLIDEKKLSCFIEEVQPHFSRIAIERFAEENNRSAGIILGQLHHRGIVGYQHLRTLLNRVSPYLDDFVQM
jgi:HTH-type transcriptional regulator / antitoxin HigA